jgi:GTP-binding protein
MSSNLAPIVAIVGRTNVGKSSLFNAIIGRREAIVAEEPGTTRDKVSARASWDGNDFWLVDTAGLKNPDDDFELSIQGQIKEAANSADVILVVVSADTQITNEDRQVANMALKSQKPVILVVNKIDKVGESQLNDWLKLGIKPQQPTSVTQNRGVDDLLRELAGKLPPARIVEAEDRVRVALVGRPNVGKSSLFNALAKKQQALVNAQAGTTRDVNRVRVRYHEETIEFIDTAGIRRSGKIERGVEQFSVLRALRAIEEADIGLLVMDVAELNVQLDQKIAGLTRDAGKGLILVVAKWDLADHAAGDKIAGQISAHYQFVYWAPLIFTSSITGQNVAKVFDLILNISQARKQRFQTNELNTWLINATLKHPPAGLKNRHPKLNHIEQEDGMELPSFKIFGAQTEFLHWSYKRYLEHSFREQWPLSGTPIRFWFIDGREGVE